MPFLNGRGYIPGKYLYIDLHGRYPPHKVQAMGLVGATRTCPATSGWVAELLGHWRNGDQGARDALIPLVYGELRRMARRYLQRERGRHTLQRAALVHEGYLRLDRQDPPQWRNRAHFFCVAARLMRHILVDHARSRLAAKHGAGAPWLSLAPGIALPE